MKVGEEKAYKLTTKIAPDVFNIILNDINEAVSGGGRIQNEYHFGDGDLKVDIRWKPKKPVDKKD